MTVLAKTLRWVYFVGAALMLYGFVGVVLQLVTGDRYVVRGRGNPDSDGLPPSLGLLVGISFAVGAFLIQELVRSRRAVVNSPSDESSRALSSQSSVSGGTGSLPLLKMDSPGRILSDPITNQVVPVGADLRGVVLRGSTESRLLVLDSSFAKTRLDDASFSEVAVIGSSLSYASASRATFQDCIFHRCSLVAILAHGAQFERCHFIGSNLNGADLSGASLVRAVFSEADKPAPAQAAVALGTNGGPCRLDRALLSRAHCGLANFRGASLIGSDFSDARCPDTSFASCKLTDSRFPAAVLQCADFSEAALDGCDFSGAVLSRADLSLTDLRRAILRSADLRGATLEDADLSGADLVDANLSEANLRDAVITDIKWSDGTLVHGANVLGLSDAAGFRTWALARGAVEH